MQLTKDGKTVYRRGGYTRQMLHSWKLGFSHPRSGKRMECVAEIPAELKALGVKIPNAAG